MLTRTALRSGDYCLALAPSQFIAAHFRRRISEYTVFGTIALSPKFVKRRLLEEIDLTATSPDFASEATSVESGATGSIALRKAMASPRFSVARLRIATIFPRQAGLPIELKPPAMRRPYILEVEYPDNAARTFVVAIRAADRSASILCHRDGRYLAIVGENGEKRGVVLGFKPRYARCCHERA